MISDSSQPPSPLQINVRCTTLPDQGVTFAEDMTETHPQNRRIGILVYIGCIGSLGLFSM
jgi:hypothetical protein